MQGGVYLQVTEGGVMSGARIPGLSSGADGELDKCLLPACSGGWMDAGLLLNLRAFFFTCLFIQRKSKSGGGAESEGERESQAGSTPSTEPDVGPHRTTMRSCVT